MPARSSEQSSKLLKIFLDTRHCFHLEILTGFLEYNFFFVNSCNELNYLAELYISLWRTNNRTGYRIRTKASINRTFSEYFL